MILKKGKPGESYNIGEIVSSKTSRFARLICHTLDEICSSRPDGISNYFELAEFVTDRAGHDKRYAMDTQKLTKNLAGNRKASVRKRPTEKRLLGTSKKGMVEQLT